MELRDYLRIVRRRWASILVLGGVCAALAAGLTALQTPSYESTARLFVSTSDTEDGQLLQGGQFSAQRVKSYADLITSRELADRVIADLDLDESPTDLSERVSAEAVLETVNLQVTVSDADPSAAQRIAQSYAEQLTDLVRELETPAGQSDAPIKATIVDAATYSETPVSPRPLHNIALGVLVGLVLGFLLAVSREMLDTRITSLDDVADVTGAPTLGTIVHDPTAAKAPLLTDIAPHAPRAESFRVLRTNLQFVDVDHSHKVFVVTSAVPGEGKTTTAVNLAISLAQGGSQAVLVECDLRRPKATERLGLDNAIGVTSVLVGKVKTADAIQTHDESGLAVMASGPVPPNPAELLQSHAMEELLKELREAYDVVILDAPPLLPVTDAAVLATKADAAMLVVSHRHVTREQVKLSIERLDQVDATLAGLVLNKVPLAKGNASTYGYGYGYGYAPTNADG